MLQSIIFIGLQECCGDCVAVLFQKRNTSKEQRLVVVLALVFVLKVVRSVLRSLARNVARNDARNACPTAILQDTFNTTLISLRKCEDSSYVTLHDTESGHHRPREATREDL